MTKPIDILFESQELEDLKEATGKIVIFVSDDGRMDQAGRKLNAYTRKTLQRVIDAESFEKLKTGDVMEVSFPTGMLAESIFIAKVPGRPTADDMREAGAAIAKARGKGTLTVLAGKYKHVADFALGLSLRSYAYIEMKTGEQDGFDDVVLMHEDIEVVEEAYADKAAIVEGVFFTRDLISKPANVLTTTSFADELKALTELGVEVEVLEEDDMEALGMGSLLCVGQGSISPSKIVVMQWNGGGDEAPFALVGKGVVFDTGGISLKPAAGMEDMTMDMGGAGVVAGTMKTLAARKAKANVVGLVGLVENMPSGNATRPGDIVTSMKGDTIEVINTDAEGRLVLADVLWYAQDRFNPSGIIDLATLTGAIIIALGHENAGVFSNDDKLADNLLKSAGKVGEGAWRMPMGDAYDKQLKSLKADMKNVGGRDGGSITAAQFLKRFVKDETPWCHIDIAGTAQTKGDTKFAPKGATGWGVMTLNQLIADAYES